MKEVGSVLTVPGYYLDDGDLGSVGNELFPASDKEPVICSVYPLMQE